MTYVTADEYRTAAKVDRFHGGQSAAQFYEDNARALESEDLVTQVAMHFAGSTSGGRDAEEQFALAGSERALAYLVGAGRLIPAGGMALTAEDVRKFIIAIERHYPEGEAELLARLRALFPATEPAEEETKAERCWAVSLTGYRCTRRVGHKGDHANRIGGILSARWPAFSPVVPAPTETGPWHHRDGRICVYVQHLPLTLRYRIGRFNLHGDFVHDDSKRQLPEGFAPFVAAEEK